MSAIVINILVIELFQLSWFYHRDLLEKNIMISFSYYCKMFLGHRLVHYYYNTEAYSEPCQTSRMDLSRIFSHNVLLRKALSKMFDRILNKSLEYVKLCLYCLGSVCDSDMV